MHLQASFSRQTVELFGLLSQAQNGDCPSNRRETAALTITRTKSADESLRVLKLKSWQACRGKTRKDAMKAS